MSNQRVVVMAPGTQTISFTREFEAPSARVFAAHVDPDLIPQWIGPRGTTVEMRHFDARTGGSWGCRMTRWWWPAARRIPTSVTTSSPS